MMLESGIKVRQERYQDKDNVGNMKVRQERYQDKDSVGSMKVVNV